MSVISTLILPDGKVIKNFQMKSLVKRTQNNQETEVTTNELKGSKLAIISIREKDIELQTIKIMDPENISSYNSSMAFGDLDSKKIGLKSLNNNISIICKKNY